MNMIATPETISMSINQNGLIAAMSKGFDSPISIIKELAQNSRRAKATKIEFNFNVDLKSFTVIDDGEGISDFSKLIGAYHSNWGEDVSSENPYGIGFLSVILASDRLIVRSNGQMLDAACEDIKTFKNLTVVPDHNQGTTITLFGEKITPLFEACFSTIFAGFDIPVFVNGVEIERIEALTAQLPFIQTEMGMLYIKSTIGHTGSTDRLEYSGFTRLYYQGFYIGHIGDPTYCNHPSSLNQSGNIVHIDYTKYDAIAPDRHKLIDEIEVIKTFKKIIHEIIRKDICDKLREFGEELILNSYHTIRDFGLLPIYNTIEFLPKAVLEEFEDYPVRQSNRDGSGHTLREPTFHPSKLDIVSGKIPIFQDIFNSENEFKFAMYCWLMSGLILDSPRYDGRQPLDSEHWVFNLLNIPKSEYDDSGVEVFYKCPVTVELTNTHNYGVSEFDNGLDHGTIFCDEIKFCGPAGEVVCDKYAFVTDDKVVIPVNEHSSEVVLQSKSFSDEFDAYNEVESDYESDKFSTWLTSARLSSDSQALLKLLLIDHVGKYPSLKGQQFVVSVSNTGDLEVHLTTK